MHQEQLLRLLLTLACFDFMLAWITRPLLTHHRAHLPSFQALAVHMTSSSSSSCAEKSASSSIMDASAAFPPTLTPTSTSTSTPTATQVDDASARAALRQLVPDLLSTNRKGMLGRVGVLGGSPVYTGAPYFSSISVLKMGADLCYVLTAEEAAPAIKAYSPELMVTPIYDGKWKDGEEAGIERIVSEVTSLIPRLHSLVLGPGLGRDERVFRAVEQIIPHIKEAGIPLVIDADGLFLMAQKPEIIKNYPLAILTPNIMEFGRLWSKMGLSDNDIDGQPAEGKRQGKGDEGKISSGTPDQVKQLAWAMGNVVIVLKGKEDVISDGRTVLICGTPGSLKRPGGLGDILSGVIGTMSAWATLNKKEQEEDKGNGSGGGGDGKGMSLLWASWWACATSKLACRQAYNTHGRSMGATHAIDELEAVVDELMPAPKVL